MTNIQEEKKQALVDEFYKTIALENAEILVRYIIDSFETNKSKNRQIDYKFDINMAKKTFSSAENNTSFQCDSEEGTLLRKIVNLLDNEDLEPNKEIIEKFDLFLKTVCDLLENKYRQEFTRKIRKIIFKDEIPEDVMPISVIKVKDFYIEKPEVDCLFVIEKMVKKDSVPQSVSKEIFDFYVETKRDPNELVKQRKEQGDPKYLSITNVRREKYWYELNLSLYVDYSFA